MNLDVIRETGFVVGMTIAAMSLTICFGLALAFSALAWMNPVFVAKLRYIIRGK